MDNWRGTRRTRLVSTSRNRGVGYPGLAITSLLMRLGIKGITMNQKLIKESRELIDATRKVERAARDLLIAERELIAKKREVDQRLLIAVTTYHTGLSSKTIARIRAAATADFVYSLVLLSNRGVMPVGIGKKTRQEIAAVVDKMFPEQDKL